MSYQPWTVTLAEYHDKYEFVAYAVKDLKSGTYGVPAFWRSSADAIRNFESSVIAQYVAESGVLFTHGNDFTLCAIGGYNTVDGCLESFEQVLYVSNAYELATLKCHLSAPYDPYEPFGFPPDDSEDDD